jgi:exodeoxyribonuclease V alpha subunit
VLPAGYVTTHVELAYASTAHGVQGATVNAAHVVIGEHTGTAAAYVGMTRGRTANTAHLIAADPAEARTQWIAVFARDRADLGPAHAAELAAVEAARYATPRPLHRVLTELHAAWTAEQRCTEQLNALQARREVLRSLVAVDVDHADQLVALEDRQRQTAIAAQRAHDRAEVSGAMVAAAADRLRGTLLDRWDAQRDTARQAARIFLTGPGRLGLRRSAVDQAEQQLADWADRWRPCLPTLPIDPAQLAVLTSSVDDRPGLRALVGDFGRRQAESAHPEHARLRAAADAAQAAHDLASRALQDARRRQEDRLTRRDAHGHPFDPAVQLASVERDVTATERELAAVRTRIADLAADPALRAQPPGRLAQEREVWRARGDAERPPRRAAAPPRPARSLRPPEPVVHSTPRPGAGPGVGR